MKSNSKLALIIVSLLLIIIFCVIGLGDSLAPLIISFTLAYILFPLIKTMELTLSAGIEKLFWK